VKILRFLALPLSLLYGLLMHIRNKLYDNKILSSCEFDVKIISIGNLTAGGTGKSPHTAYITRLLSDYKVGILSRGYGRKTKGFVLADKNSTSEQIGDEPLMFSRMFPDVPVAVHEDRVMGVSEMVSLNPDIDVILLDDAFQHRRIRPGLSILLTDYYKPYSKNFPFPTGNLREFKSGAKRADLIVITKGPIVNSPLLEREYLKRLKIQSNQALFFSFIRHRFPEPVLDHPPLTEKSHFTNILLVTGIANPYPLAEYLTKMCSQLTQIPYPDHHKYSLRDIEHIQKQYEEIVTKNKIIVTTEKDLMRLENAEFIPILSKLPIYYVHIDVCFHNDEFDKTIIKYVRGN